MLAIGVWEAGTAAPVTLIFLLLVATQKREGVIHRRPEDGKIFRAAVGNCRAMPDRFMIRRPVDFASLPGNFLGS
jgi:hypothetical protein